MLNFFICSLVIYVLFCGLLFGCQRALLYHPDQTIPNPVEFGLENIEEVRIKTLDGFQLLAWWHPPDTGSEPILVYFHGNAGHLGHRAEKIRHFINAGYGVLLVAYRYNAGTGGSPSEVSIYADARAAMSFAKEKNSTDNPIIVYGESLGTAVAVAISAENNVAGVILEAPYTSIADVAQSHYWYLPARFMVLDKFEASKRIDQIGAPLLIVHGEQDTIIPASFGRSLFEQAVEPKEAIFLPYAGHNNLFDYGAVAHILEFIERRVLSSRR